MMWHSKHSTLLLLFLSHVHVHVHVHVHAWIPTMTTTPETCASSSLRLYAEPSPSSRKRMFAQPSFQTPSTTFNNNNSKEDSVIVNRRADSKIGQAYQEKIRTAGRKGTKRFVDPCKVFVGNLPYHITSSQQLSRFVLDAMGQSRLILHSCKIIQDWKTGQSKGYGFVIFTDPIFATTCMDQVNGKILDGRVITVDQGKRKEQENILYLKKKRKAAETEEEAAIASALEAAENEEEDYDDDDDDDIPNFGGDSDEDLELDAMLFGLTGNDDDNDDDDSDDYDGVFLEHKPIYEGGIDPNLNREQRRDAARRLKRQKLPHKGFG